MRVKFSRLELKNSMSCRSHCRVGQGMTDIIKITLPLRNNLRKWSTMNKSLGMMHRGPDIRRRINEFSMNRRLQLSLQFSSRRQEAPHTTLRTLMTTMKIRGTAMIINKLSKMKDLTHPSKRPHASHHYALWNLKIVSTLWIEKKPMTSPSSLRWKMHQETLSLEWARPRSSRISHRNPIEITHQSCSPRTRSTFWTAPPEISKCTAEIWSVLDRPSPAWVLAAYHKRGKMCRAGE